MPSNFNTDPLKIDLSRLQAQLLTSGVQQSNNPLFQVINQLIASVKNIAGAINTGAASGITDLSGLTNRTYWTELDETANLPMSRQAIAGVNITLDYSIDGKVVISATGGGGEPLGYWAPLTDGDNDETDLVFADGEAVMVFVPVP